MTDWFLPPGVPGSSDDWCSQTVPTAEIRVYADYDAYYDRLAALFSQAKTNDEIFLVGFDVDLEKVLSLKHKNFPVGGSKPPQRSDVPDVPDTIERLLKDAIGRGVKVVVVAANKNGPFGVPDPAARDALVRSLASSTNPPVLLQTLPKAWFVHSKTWIFDDFDDGFVLIGSGNFWPNSFVSANQPAEGEFGVAFTSKADGKSAGFPGVQFARALRIKLWERLRQNRDPNYKFPRDALASFDDEVKELQKPIGGVDPFEVMK